MPAMSRSPDDENFDQIQNLERGLRLSRCDRFPRGRDSRDIVEGPDRQTPWIGTPWPDLSLILRSRATDFGAAGDAEELVGEMLEAPGPQRQQQEAERQKDDQEDREQDLGYRSRPRRDIGEAERTGNQRDDEKDESPFQHGSTHEFCPSF